jgi:hypothetical protein
MSEWADLRWFVVFNGIADRWLWGFDAERWRLRHGDPANGTLGILPAPGDPVATIDDALWLADALAFDHDAPVGISPAWSGVYPAPPKDSAGIPPFQPVQPLGGDAFSLSYWQSLSVAYNAAAELRFNGSYVIRYEGDDPAPDTNFAHRFSGREELVSMYAMAARQADLLSEYLCLYRILEAADGRNGKSYAREALPRLDDHDFGILRVISPNPWDRSETAANAFAVYKERAVEELTNLATGGVADVPRYLYKIRNSLAHGKTDVLAHGRGEAFQDAARALPIVKLLARMAVERPDDIVAHDAHTRCSSTT